MDSNTLFVDIGNTNIKLRMRGQDSSIAHNHFDISLIPAHTNAIISNVAKSSNIISQFNNPIIANYTPYKDLIFEYDTSQLGIDRYLATIAGYELFPNEKHIAIIDIGTFITIEYIYDSTYMSGGISPGIEILQKSHHFKGLESQGEWRLGTTHMFLYYILQKITTLMETHDKILITGGGQELVKDNIWAKYRRYKNYKKISYHSNLVLDGLELYPTN